MPLILSVQVLTVANTSSRHNCFDIEKVYFIPHYNLQSQERSYSLHSFTLPSRDADNFSN